MRILFASLLTLSLFCFSNTGRAQSPLLRDTIKEANMELTFPNDKWELTGHSGDSLIRYIFKREPIIDQKGDSIIPAVIVVVDDASKYQQDIVIFSFTKRGAFAKMGVKVDQIMLPSDKKYPLTYKNAITSKTSYTQQGKDHILYMIHIINKQDKGIQVYLDMTKDVAGQCDDEFNAIIRSLRDTGDH